jgi:Polyketide cyclase / dehydrase and lipid transport
MRTFIISGVLLTLAGVAQAEVKSATPAGFEVEQRAVVAADLAETWAMLGRPGEWWNDEHTYSGDSANMRLKLKAGGCFCERIPKDGGTIEHARIVFAQPAATLRMQGGLGPLQAEAAMGTLTWTLNVAPEGTEVTQTYVVGGYVRGGADKLAPIVDRVLAEQLDGLKARLAR